jgi:hypothetical protein
MGIDLTRRRLLRSVGASGLVGLAGCAADVTEGDVRAEAVYVAPDNLDSPVRGTVDAEVLVHNVGIPADLEITVEAINLDADPDEPESAIVATASLVEYYEQDEQSAVTIPIEPGPRADGLGKRVGPAD